MMMRTLTILFLLSGVVQAADAPSIKWSGADLNGATINIPAAGTAVVAFVRPEQDQSKQALKQITSDLADAKSAQVIVFVSGPVAAERGAALAGELPKGWAIVADPDFAASGKMNIHVWPTTLVVKSDGTQVAHLAGLSKSFSTELAAYLDFASARIDQAQLQQRLTSTDVITDSPEQIAARHLQVAQKLLEQGKIEPARAELAEGLKHAPSDPLIQLTLARIHVLLNEPADALQIVQNLPPGSVPGWQLAMVRGRALILQEKWSDAKNVLPDALKLNPSPSEAHYLLGLCYQHDKDFEHAADEFRAAFEAAPGSAKLRARP